MSDEGLYQTYPDILEEDTAPGLVDLVRDLDAVSRTTAPSPGLARAVDRALRERSLARQRHPWMYYLLYRRRPMRRAHTLPIALLAVVVLAGAAYHMIPTVERAFFVDAGTQEILNGNLAARLNLSRAAGDYTVTLQRAYADVNRIVVGYIVRGPDGHPFNDFLHRAFLKDSLRDAAGDVLRPLGGGTSARGGAVLDNFDASTVRGNPEDVTLQLTIPPPQVLVGDRWMAPLAATATPARFQFTIPFHHGRVAILNQTVAAGGTAVTLQRVIVSPTEARMFLSGLPGTGIFPHLAVGAWDSGNPRLIGWQRTSAGQVLRGVWKASDGSVVCDFPASLMNERGGWTLTVKAGAPTADGVQVTGGPWVFHFVVPGGP